MAEVVGKLVTDKLIPLLKDEINLAEDVQNQLESVKNQLLLIRAYLKDADKKAEIGESRDAMKEWVRQMKEVSFHIEDAIDEYLLVMDNNKLLEKDMCGIVGTVASCIYDFFRGIMPRRKILEQLCKISESLRRLEDAKRTYGINPESNTGGGSDSSNSTLHYLRQSALFIEDDQLVGVDHTKQVLCNWLSEKESGRTIVTVVGDGGLGKTTVVNKVFNYKKNKKSFDCYAWITVSQSLRADNLLKNLLKCFYMEAGEKDSANEISELDNNSLVKKLGEYLRERSNYMIVFDDVWEINFWGYVENALPKDKGRIIITTRDRRVAEFCGGHGRIHIYEMQPLNRDDAWNLFCLKAFSEGCPSDLKGLSKEFVKKCNGVPLAIVAIASLLATKNKNVLEWQKVYDNLRSKLLSDPHLSSVYQVLSESYQDLDYHLKSCLLYFGLFPEDYSISCVRLINLWIAEGFVENKEKDGQTLEEVAEECLTELIARSLVKVAKVYCYPRVRSCRVHDLTHDFILRKCEELNFCQVKKSDEFKLDDLTRRLSIDKSVDDVTMKRSAANYGLIRSCFLFSIHQGTPTSLFESLFSSFKLLVRLDCEGAPLDYLPEAVGNLFHLKYLNLRNTYIKMIPKFIGNLQNLETLDLKYTQVCELPIEISKLIKLRHLLAYRFGPKPIGVKLKEGIWHLSSLQKLRMVDASDHGDVIMKEVKNLKQMRDLGIFKLNRKDGKLLCNAMESMTYLRSLAIVANKEEVIDLASLSVPPWHLQRLYLDGRLEKLPDWIPRLKNLVKLRLTYSGLIEDPLPFIKNLSTLLELHLYDSYEGNELYFREGWFTNLKVLAIELPNLETLKINEGGMPHLQMSSVYPLPKTMQVPSHIHQLIHSSFRLLRKKPFIIHQREMLIG